MKLVVVESHFETVLVAIRRNELEALVGRRKTRGAGRVAVESALVRCVWKKETRRAVHMVLPGVLGDLYRHRGRHGGMCLHACVDHRCDGAQIDVDHPSSHVSHHHHHLFSCRAHHLFSAHDLPPPKPSHRHSTPSDPPSSPSTHPPPSQSSPYSYAPHHARL